MIGRRTKLNYPLFVELESLASDVHSILSSLFTPPLFAFFVGNPENWIFLATFEAAALLVIRRSAKVLLHARHIGTGRARMATLYELSRAILLIHTRSAVIDQLSDLICEFLKAELVGLCCINFLCSIIL